MKVIVEVPEGILKCIKGSDDDSPRMSASSSVCTTESHVSDSKLTHVSGSFATHLSSYSYEFNAPDDEAEAFYDTPDDGSEAFCESVSTVPETPEPHTSVESEEEARENEEESNFWDNNNNLDWENEQWVDWENEQWESIDIDKAAKCDKNKDAKCNNKAAKCNNNDEDNTSKEQEPTCDDIAKENTSSDYKCSSICSSSQSSPCKHCLRQVCCMVELDSAFKRDAKWVKTFELKVARCFKKRDEKKIEFKLRLCRSSRRMLSSRMKTLMRNLNVPVVNQLPVNQATAENKYTHMFPLCVNEAIVQAFPIPECVPGCDC